MPLPFFVDVSDSEDLVDRADFFDVALILVAASSSLGSFLTPFAFLAFVSALSDLAFPFAAAEVDSAFRMAFASFAAACSICDFFLASFFSIGVSESDSLPIAVSEAFGSLAPLVF